MAIPFFWFYLFSWLKYNTVVVYTFIGWSFTENKLTSNNIIFKTTFVLLSLFPKWLPFSQIE